MAKEKKTNKQTNTEDHEKEATISSNCNIAVFVNGSLHVCFCCLFLFFLHITPEASL